MNDRNLGREKKTDPQESSHILADATISKNRLESKANPEKKLKKLLYISFDWAMIVMSIIILSHTEGMGHHLGHTGLFLLMLALVARPICTWWNAPLRKRRAIGIAAFAATLAHAIYATSNILGGNMGTVFSMSALHQWGMWAGILAFAIMTPAAVTSFPSMQRRLGKNWRKIHLWTVPALGLAVLHTVLIGPHYLADFELEMIDGLRVGGIIVLTITVFLLRQPIVYSVLKSRKLIKPNR